MRQFLQKILPRRIGTQIAALIVASLVIANLAIAIVTVFLLQVPKRTETSGGMLANLAFTAKLLDAAPTPTARAEILRSAQASNPELSYLDATPTMPTIAPPNDRLVKDLKAVLGDRFQIISIHSMEVPGPPRIAVSLPGGGIIAASMPPPPNPAPMLIGIGTFLAIALAGLSVWVAQALTSPLARFVEAAERFSASGADVRLDERGPIEIGRLARALNDMRDRIRSLITDRTRMLAAIGHDLRTPITRLRLRAEDIDCGPLREHVIRDLDTMQRMVQSALWFLRDQSIEPRAPARADLSSVVQSLCDDFADMGQELTFSAPPHIYIECEPEQITRAIVNLVENALKYGNNVALRVLDRGDEVYIEIEDDGPGINPEDRPKVIEPFYRADAARSPDEDSGFGLGLSIATAIIEAHHGRLELREALPHGLIARLIIPAALDFTLNS